MGLVVKEYRFFTGRVDDVGQRHRNQGQPAHEMRVRLERVRMIIKKCDLGAAREHDGMGGAGLFKRIVVAREQGFHVCRIQGTEIRILV